MIIEQLTIYDYLQKKEDPLYVKLKSLQKGDKINLGFCTVEINPFGLYQILDFIDDSDTAFSSLEECYQYISKNDKFYNFKGE